MNPYYLKALQTAFGVAECSGDRSVRIGAVICPDVPPGGHRSQRPTPPLVIVGYNDIPEGVEDHPDRRARPRKYLFTEHAERAAVHAAARIGFPTAGCIMAVTHFPCADCARAIIGAGITKLITPAGAVLPIFVGSSAAARIMLTEAEVETLEY